MRVLLALAALVLGGCTVRHPIELDISSPNPFSCVDLAGRELVERVGVARRDVLYVFDFVRAPTYPSCRVASILEECASDGCRAVAADRVCVRIPWERIVELSARGAIEGPADLIEGAPIVTSDAPDEPVIVRLTAQVAPADEADDPCRALEDGSLPRFDPMLLIGCGYSCPTVLDAEPSRIEVDLDPALDGMRCGIGVVAICANLGIP